MINNKMSLTNIRKMQHTINNKMPSLTETIIDKKKSNVSTKKIEILQ